MHVILFFHVVSLIFNTPTDFYPTACSSGFCIPREKKNLLTAG